MSTNCISCVTNTRTGSDLLCDSCRENRAWHWSADPMVAEAFEDGRRADDIQVVACPVCGWHTYYNEGSHWSCRNPACGQTADCDALIDEGLCRSVDDCVADEVLEY